jgi:beta-lactam-binding protein with PASTA domain
MNFSSENFFSKLEPVFAWLRVLVRNGYFWAGIGGILCLGLGVYFLVDAVIMPSYTRHGVAVQVPKVEKKPFEKAARRVKKQNLQVKRQVGRYNPRVGQNVVVDQNPPPNAKVKPGRRVYLTVNAGKAPVVDLPDLNGISIREAKNRVSSLGLKVGTVEPDSIPSPYRGTVTRQRPKPSDSLKKGGTVDLWYSTGMGTDTVQVPDVVGHSVKAARAFLLRHKLRTIILGRNESSSVPADTSAPRWFVRKQGRVPDTPVQAGTEIRLFVTDDSTQVPAPTTEIPDTLMSREGSEDRSSGS